MKKSLVLLSLVLVTTVAFAACSTNTTPAAVGERLEYSLNQLSNSIRNLDTLDNAYLAHPDITPAHGNEIIHNGGKVEYVLSLAVPKKEIKQNSSLLTVAANVNMPNQDTTDNTIVRNTYSNLEEIKSVNAAQPQHHNSYEDRTSFVSINQNNNYNDSAYASQNPNYNAEINYATYSQENATFTNQLDNAVSNPQGINPNIYHFSQEEIDNNNAAMKNLEQNAPKQSRKSRFANRKNKDNNNEYPQRYTLDNQQISDNNSHMHGYIAKVETLYSVTNDAIAANTNLDSYKTQIINTIEQIRPLALAMKNGEVTPSKGQVVAINNYINDIKTTVARIRNSNGRLNNEINKINNIDRGGITTSVDVLNSNYIRILNHLDVRIAYLRNAEATLQQLELILNEASDNHNANLDQVEARNNINYNNPEANIDSYKYTHKERGFENHNEIMKSKANKTKNEEGGVYDYNKAGFNTKRSIKNIDSYKKPESVNNNQNHIADNNIVNNSQNNTHLVSNQPNQNINQTANQPAVNNQVGTHAGPVNGGINGINGMGHGTCFNTPDNQNAINAPNGTFQNGIITQNNLNNGVNNGVNGFGSGYAGSNSPYTTDGTTGVRKNINTYGNNSVIDFLNRGTVNNGINTLNIGINSDEIISEHPNMVALDEKLANLPIANESDIILDNNTDKTTLATIKEENQPIINKSTVAELRNKNAFKDNKQEDNTAQEEVLTSSPKILIGEGQELRRPNKQEVDSDINKDQKVALNNEDRKLQDAKVVANSFNNNDNKENKLIASNLALADKSSKVKSPQQQIEEAKAKIIKYETKIEKAKSKIAKYESELNNTETNTSELLRKIA